MALMIIVVARLCWMQLVLEMAVPQYPSINPSNTHVEEI
jgi:hypothetical protein